MDEASRIVINVNLDRALVADIDRLSTLTDQHRYEVMEKLLRMSMERVEKEGEHIVR